MNKEFPRACKSSKWCCEVFLALQVDNVLFFEVHLFNMITKMTTELNLAQNCMAHHRVWLQ